jgi:hypothetical protein
MQVVIRRVKSRGPGWHRQGQGGWSDLTELASGLLVGVRVYLQVEVEVTALG